MTYNERPIATRIINKTDARMMAARDKAIELMRPHTDQADDLVAIGHGEDLNDFAVGYHRGRASRMLEIANLFIRAYHQPIIIRPITDADLPTRPT